ncbi:MAG: 16S rRNA (guanine(966)-N(2))-methyltransferase RsmD [Gemmatimonadetes bacterium]|nr:16S rRNA (guanine(966)-N(2))-methyltransferase RsmD [Gemmatimonadota bacterium]
MRIIAGEWKGRRLVPVRGRRVRPTSDRVREAWMSILQPLLPGARVLDLFSGSGALGLETLSRGASHCTFVERSRGVLRVLTRNVEQLDATGRSTLVLADAMRFVGDLAGSDGAGVAYDLALADPPYDRGLASELIARFRWQPFAKALWVEHRSSEEVPVGPDMERRVYGDTVLTGVYAPDAGGGST